MIVNGATLLVAAPIKDMATQKHKENGVSWGLSEAGYDIRIKQDVIFHPENAVEKAGVWVDGRYAMGRFVIHLNAIGVCRVFPRGVIRDHFDGNSGHFILQKMMGAEAPCF